MTKGEIVDVKAYVKAEVTSENIDDGDNMFIIDPESLSGRTKVSNLSLVWDKRRLASINASANDQTAEIVSSVASGVAKLAISSIAPISTVGVAKSDDPKKFVECNSTIALALKKAGEYEDNIDKLTFEISAISERILSLRKALENSDFTSSIECKASDNSDLRCKLNKKIEELDKRNIDLGRDKKKLARVLKTITHEQTIRWPENSYTSMSMKENPIVIPARVLDKWVVQSESKIDWNVSEEQRTTADFSKEFDVHLNIGKIGTYGVTDLEAYQLLQDKLNNVSIGKTESIDNATLSKVNSSAESLPKPTGLRYRLPAAGYVTVCRRVQCSPTDKEYLVTSKREEIMQLGYIFHVPVVSESFSDKSFVMAFNEQGFPIKAEIKSLESAGENIANVFGNVVDEVVAYRAVKAEKIEKNKPKTALELIKEETELLVAQKALIDAENGLSPAGTAAMVLDLKAKTELAEVQQNYLEAVTKLEELLSVNKDIGKESQSVIKMDAFLLQAEVTQLEADSLINSSRRLLNTHYLVD